MIPAHFKVDGGEDRSAAGEPPRDPGREVCAPLAHITTDLAAMNAFTAAADAFLSVGYYDENFVAAALSDHDKLIRLELGRYPESGVPADPSPGGPLCLL